VIPDVSGGVGFFFFEKAATNGGGRNRYASIDCGNAGTVNLVLSDQGSKYRSVRSITSDSEDLLSALIEIEAFLAP
jgi:hypothetical protein